MVLKLRWVDKRVLWAFEKNIFQFFANFWVTKLKPKFCYRKVPRKLFWRYLKVKNKCSERLKWVTKLKRFFGKASQSVQGYLNQNLVVGASWKMVLKLPWSQKGILWAFEKSIFQVFANFSLKQLKAFFWES